jgi:hypothetical protein
MSQGFVWNLLEIFGYPLMATTVLEEFCAMMSDMN